MSEACTPQKCYVVISRNSNNKISFIPQIKGKYKNTNKLKEENSKLLNRIHELEDTLHEALENDKIKTENFSNISHELRTPLNVILGIIQLYEQNYSGELLRDKENKSERYLKLMKQNCYRLLRLINNFIDINKIDAGYFSLTKRNCNIISVVEDITMSIVEYAKVKGISLIFDTDVEERIIACDPDKIERIVMNLLSNAIKFTPIDGMINVKISDGEEFVTISIKDTGSGIPKDKQHLIFNRFMQADKMTCNQSEGSGIGLSLSKSLTEMHGGSINFISEEGVGTEFIVKLPTQVLPQENFTDIYQFESKSKIEKINVEFSDIYN